MIAPTQRTSHIHVWDIGNIYGHEYTCEVCGASGKTCPTCHGSEQDPNGSDACPECQGWGIVEVEEVTP